MTDIVERLRGPHGFQPECYVLRKEAADEIERLRADRAQLVLMTELQRASNVEIERLRSDVRKLRDVLTWADDNCPGKCAGPIHAVLVATAKTP